MAAERTEIRQLTRRVQELLELLARAEREAAAAAGEAAAAKMQVVAAERRAAAADRLCEEAEARERALPQGLEPQHSGEAGTIVIGWWWQVQVQVHGCLARQPACFSTLTRNVPPWCTGLQAQARKA